MPEPAKKLILVAALCFTAALQNCAAGQDDGYGDAPASDPAADMDELQEQPLEDADAPEGGDGSPPDIADAQDLAADDADDGAWDDVPEIPVDPDAYDSWDGADSLDWIDAPDSPPDVPPDLPDIIDAWDAPPDAPDIVPDDVPAEEASGEVWMEISYEYRSTYESAGTADWSYSSTPSWTAAQWAPSTASWPYINAPDGDVLVSDPIGGTVLDLAGCYDRFRLFFGLEELSHVGHATVTLEGRSRDTSAGVDFEVWNPGASSSIVVNGSMSNDWTADVVTVDFTAEAGNGFQAVEIAPIARSCDLALRRVRLTLYDIY